MTIPELYDAVVSGGPAVMGLIAAAPLLLGALAAIVFKLGLRGLSQSLCNAGIIAALTTVAIEIAAIMYASNHGVNVVEETDVLILGMPLWFVGASFLVEHLIHPGKQEHIRARIRSVLLVLITIAVVFFILGRLNMHMLIFGSILGFVLFIAAIIGVFYWVTRKVV